MWNSCRFWYLPCNDVIAKIALRDIDLLFKGKFFENIYISWNDKNNVRETFVHFDVCRRTVLLRKLHSVTLFIEN